MELCLLHELSIALLSTTALHLSHPPIPNIPFQLSGSLNNAARTGGSRYTLTSSCGELSREFVEAVISYPIVDAWCRLRRKS